MGIRVSGPVVRYLVDAAIIAAAAWAQLQIGRGVLAWALPRVPAQRARTLRFGLAALWLAMAVGFVLGYHGLARWVPLPRSIAAWIHGAVYLWAFSSTGAWCVYALWKRLVRADTADRFDPARRRALRATGGVLASAPFVLTGFGTFIQRTDFRVREVDLPVPDLPDDLRGLRLVQISDIHLSPYLSEAEFARAVDAANGLRPDLALVTGDLISSAGDPLDACLRQVARLRATAGILGCMGNHEIYAAAEDHAAGLGRSLGIEFLRGSSRPLRFGKAVLNVAGVDYQRASLRPRYLESAEKLVRAGAVNVLLSHNPDVYPVAAAKGFQVVLAGHTHGGQVQVEILNQSLNVARFITPFVYGLYRDAGAAAYVTRGIGTIGMPARIGAPPEIALLRLVRA